MSYPAKEAMAALVLVLAWMPRAGEPRMVPTRSPAGTLGNKNKNKNWGGGSFGNLPALWPARRAFLTEQHLPWKPNTSALCNHPPSRSLQSETSAEGGRVHNLAPSCTQTWTEE